MLYGCEITACNTAFLESSLTKWAANFILRSQELEITIFEKGKKTKADSGYAQTPTF